MKLSKFILLPMVLLFLVCCSPESDVVVPQDQMLIEDTDQEHEATDSSDETNVGSEETETEDYTTDANDESGEESNDDENGDDEESSEENDTALVDDTILGLWVLSELRIADGVDDANLELAQLVVGLLVQRQCDLISFEFNHDGTVQVENKVGFLELSLTVPCPEETEVNTAMWALEDGQLTFINDGQQDVAIMVAFEDENTLIISGMDIDSENFTGTDAVFTKRQ